MVYCAYGRFGEDVHIWQAIGQEGNIMTITLFVTLFTVGATVAGLFTEAIKKAYQNAGKQYSPNVIALIDSVVVGGLGTAAAYMLMDIPWTVNNVICLLLMAVVVWLASMLGYDKIAQMLSQIKEVKDTSGHSS